MDKFTQVHQRDPTAEEITHWISLLPNSRLDEMQEWARDFFDKAARAYLEEEHAKELQKATEDALVSRVRANMETSMSESRAMSTAITTKLDQSLSEFIGRVSFKSTWLPNTFVGLVSSFIFAVLIIVASVIFTRDPSPIALAKRFSNVGAPPAPEARPTQ